MLNWKVAVGAMCGVVGVVASASAAPVLVQKYDLLDSPDGAVSLPEYGLRLDQLGTLDGPDGGTNADGGNWIFSFEDDHGLARAQTGASTVSLRVFQDDVTNAFSIRIQGTVFGGKKSNGGFDANRSGAWELDFTYDTDVTVGALAGDGSQGVASTLIAQVLNAGVVNHGSGTLKPIIDGNFSLLASQVAADGVRLTGKQSGVNAHGTPGQRLGFEYSRRANTGSEDTGTVAPHRLDEFCNGPASAPTYNGNANAAADICDRWSGFGWLQVAFSDGQGNFGAFQDTTTNDFLFTGVNVPIAEPVTLGLLGLGLIGLGAARRRLA